MAVGAIQSSQSPCFTGRFLKYVTGQQGQSESNLRENGVPNNKHCNRKGPQQGDIL